MFLNTSTPPAKDKDEFISEKQITSANVEKNIIQCVQQSEEIGDEESVIETDNELNEAILTSSKTPHLKRLRRSIQSTNKRKKSFNDHYLNVKDEKNMSHASSPKTSQDITINNHSLARSFDDKLFSVNSPSVFSDASLHSPVTFVESSPILAKPATPKTQSSDTASSIMLTPLVLPPSYDEVIESCEKFEIFEHEFQKPFYSNPEDLTNKKEIGHTVLSIQGNKLTDCEEFQSVLIGDLKSLSDWRRKQLLNVRGPAVLNRYRNTQQIREYFATEKRIVITPQISAPSKHDSKLWLKAREIINNKYKDQQHTIRDEDDSPIKVRRQKVTMMFNDDEANGINDFDEDIDCSGRSLSLTPLTPVNCEIKDNKTAIDDKNCTPLSTKDFKINLTCKRRKHFSKSSKLSLMKKIKNISVKTIDSQLDCKLEEHKIKCIDSKNLIKSDLNQSLESSKYSHSGSTSLSSQCVSKFL